MTQSQGDVQQHQTPTGLPMEDQAVMDLITDSVSSGASDENKPDDSEGKEKPPKKEDEEGGETPPKESKPATEKDKKDEDGGSGEDGAEPFASLGDQHFKTKEELLEFTKSQAGFNRLIVGNLKKVHPDWFDESGKLIAEKIKPAQADVADAQGVLDKKKEAEEAGKEFSLSGADKEKLRKVGFAFVEDIESLKKEKTAKDEKAENDALEDWGKDKPDAKLYYGELIELTESGKLDLDEAWDIVKKRHKIIDETPPAEQSYDDGVRDGKKKSGLDTSASSPSGGKSGVAPEKKETDLMDTLIGAGGIF